MDQIKRNSRLQLHSVILLTIGLGYLTWCFATIAYMGRKFEWMHLGVMVVTVVVYAMGFVLAHRKERSGSIVTQWDWVNWLLCLCFILVFIGDLRSPQIHGLQLLADICMILGTGVLAYRYWSYSAWQKQKNEWLQYWKQEGLFFLLILLIMLISCYPTMGQFKWDGALYEQACEQMNIHSLSSLGAYGHLGQAYGVLYCLLYAIFGETQRSMICLNLLLYVISVWAFYECIKVLLPEEKKSVCRIATLIYAFSPFVFGLINYYSLDYMTMCLFSCMLYFLLTRQWCYHFVAALLFVFTKEPAIVVYGGICIGEVIREWMHSKKHVQGSRVLYVLKQSQYYYMLCVAFLWMITFAFLGGWSGGEGGFSIDQSYIGEKTRALFVLNFTWIMVVLLIAGMIVMIIRKEYQKCDMTWMIGCICALILFTMFSYAFKTVNHARYTATVPVILYMMAIYMTCHVLKKWFKQGMLITCALLMLLSCYMTIDPVSKACFEVVETGEGEMITLGIPVPGDSMIYNKQMLGFEYTMNMAVADAIRNGYQIYVPTYEGVPNLFDGLMGTMEQKEGFFETEQYFEEESGKRMRKQEGLAEAFSLTEIQDKDSLLTVMEQGQVGKRCYLYAEMMGCEEAQLIERNYPIMEQNSFSYGSWKIYTMVF